METLAEHVLKNHIGYVNGNSNTAVSTVNTTNVANDTNNVKIVVSDENKKEKNGIDIPELIMLFQSLGFCLGKFEKSENNSTKTVSSSDIRVELSCPTSGMHAVLTKPSEDCKCPSQEVACNAEFWNISGTVPGSQENVTMSHSSLLPVISPMKRKLATDLLNSALKVINRKQCNANEETFMISSRKSNECLSVSSLSPMGTPITSSPLPPVELNETVIANLREIKKIVDQTLCYTATKNVVTNMNKRKSTPVLKRSPNPAYINVQSKISVAPLGPVSITSVRKITGDKGKFLTPKPPKPAKNNNHLNLTGPRKDTPFPNNKTLTVKKVAVSNKVSTPSKIQSKIPSALSANKKK